MLWRAVSRRSIRDQETYEFGWLSTLQLRSFFFSSNRGVCDEISKDALDS